MASQFHGLVYGNRNTVEIFASCRRIMGLSAAATLDKLGGLADNLACVQSVFAHHIIAEHDAKQRLVVGC